jgi:uncharacterized protein (TIGR03066 family)
VLLLVAVALFLMCGGVTGVVALVAWHYWSLFSDTAAQLPATARTEVVLGGPLGTAPLQGPTAKTSRDDPPLQTAKEPPKKEEPMAPSGKAGDLIIGKWQNLNENDKSVLEFTRDGSLLVTVPDGLPVRGTYKFLDTDRMQVELEVAGMKITQKLTVQVTSDQLTTTDEALKVDRFKRFSGPVVSQPPPRPDGWKEFTSRERGFSVLFPGKPNESSRKGPKGDTYSCMAQADAGVSTYSVLCTEVAQDIGAAGAKAVLDGATAPLAKNTKSKHDIKLGDYPGVELQLELDALGIVMTSRIYLVKQRLYQVIAASTRDKKDAAQFAKFLDSFKLTDMVARPEPEPAPESGPPPPKVDVKVTASGQSLRGATQDLVDLKVTDVTLPARTTLPCLTWADEQGSAFFALDSAGVLRRVSFPDFKAVQKADLGKKCSWLALSAEGLVVSLPELQEVWVVGTEKYNVKRAIPVPSLKRAVSAPGLSVAFASNGDELYELDLRKGTAAKFSGEAGQAPGFADPVLTPDGKYLFTRGGFENMHRFAVQDGKLTYQQSSPRIAQGRVDVGIQISPDSRRVCLPCYAGNYGAGKYGCIFVYGVGNIEKEEFILDPGCMAVGFDPKGGYLLGEGGPQSGQTLRLFDANGQLRKDYKLGTGGVLQMLVYPAGNKVLLLTGEKAMLVEVPRQN